MYFLIFILPLFGFFCSGFFVRFLGGRLSIFFSLFFSFCTFLCAFFIFYEVCLLNTIVNLKLFKWFSFNILCVNFGLLFDTLTVLMLVIISCISFLVQLYSLGYMEGDPYVPRFFSYLSLFTFFMLMLVTADNYVQLFLGWEGVGLCSYLLIGFWFTRVLANKAALKAMIMNRISDVLFIYGILLLLLYFKTTDYLVLSVLINLDLNKEIIFLGFNANLLTIICFFFLIGSIGKSAQMGLHTWLPDAMEGPTPVSSLLHAATMVTAGVFLILRSSFFFEQSGEVLFLVMIVGGVTSFFSSIIALYQFDIKKVIAYSTCSQLGYMFFSCGLSNYNIAFFHLFNHAFFKALLFLSAGSVIHALFDEQDMRRMGLLVNFLPFSFLAFLVGSFSIMGFPFLTGFFSKDLLLELAYSRYTVDSLFIYLLGILSAFFTAAYSIRLLLIVFFNKMYSFRRFVFSSECYLVMFISMFFLIFASIFIGYFFSDLVMGWGTFFWGNSFFFCNNSFVNIDAHFLSPFIKNLPVFFSLIGFFCGIFFVEVLNYFRPFFYWLNNFIVFSTDISSFNTFYFFINLIGNFFYHALFFNFFYNKFFNFIFEFSYYFLNKSIDKGFFEYFGPFGIYKLFYVISNFFKFNPLSVIFFNVAFIFLFIFLFLFYLFLLFFKPWFFIMNSSLIGFIFFVLFLFLQFW